MLNQKFKNKHHIGFCGLGPQAQKLILILKQGGFSVISGFNKSSKMNRAKVKKILPDIKFYDSLNDFFDSGIKVVFIATSYESNYKFAVKCIKRKISVFAEKPVFKNLQQIKTLYKLSIANKVLFHVNYKFLYSDLINNNYKLLEKPKIIFFDWNKFGSFNNNIVFNLLIHDLAILFYKFGNKNYFNFNLIAKIIKDDFIFIYCVFEQINVVIRINRLSKIYNKKISIFHHNGNSFFLNFKDKTIYKFNSKKLYLINNRKRYYLDENLNSINFFFKNLHLRHNINKDYFLEKNILKFINKLYK